MRLVEGGHELRSTVMDLLLSNSRSNIAMPRNLSVQQLNVPRLEELIASIDEDPWGHPHRLVLNRLRRSSPGLTESLDIVTLNTVLDSLFPVGETHDPSAF